MSTIAAPAEPVNPVSHASRSSQAGTYSFCWRSARGTMQPVKPRRVSSVRSAATRGALAARWSRSSNDWKRASNMAAIYGAAGGAAMRPSYFVGWVERARPNALQLPPLSRGGSRKSSTQPTRSCQHQRRPAVEANSPFEHQSARTIAGERRIRLRRQQSGEDDPPVWRNEPAGGRREPFERLEQDVGKDEREPSACPERAGTDAGGMDDVDMGGDAICACVVARGRDGAGIDVAR